MPIHSFRLLQFVDFQFFAQTEMSMLKPNQHIFHCFFFFSVCVCVMQTLKLALSYRKAVVSVIDGEIRVISKGSLTRAVSNLFKTK